MSDPLGVPAYSIAAVSKLIGISCHALRAWERRYGFPTPSRSPNGHRRYSAEQLDILRTLAAQIHAGQTIGNLMAEQRFAGRTPHPDVFRESPPPYLAFMDCLGKGDMDGADQRFQAMASQFEAPELVTEVIAPALTEAGQRWFRGDWRILEEHCATTFLRRQLECLIETARRKNTRSKLRVVVGSVNGERHEGGRWSCRSYSNTLDGGRST